MQHDEVIWQVIRHNHCSYMAKIETGKFCRNPYNVTGICNRSSCPLANSRYATIRDHEGVFYLYMKTIERAHMPNKLWERVKLPKNYIGAIKIIDKHMMFWPKLLVHKMKQRLTKMTQMRIRMKKLKLKISETLKTVPRKESKRDARRLEKAEKAALLDKRIEEELIERLKKGVYPENEILNADFKTWKGYLDLIAGEEDIEDKVEEEEEVEYVEEEDEIDDIEDTFAMNTKDDDSDGLEDDDEDLDEADGKAGRRGSRSDTKSKKKATVIVEVEREDGGRSKRKAVH